MSQSSKSSPAEAPLKRGKGVTGNGDDGVKLGQGNSGSGGLCMPDPEKIRKMALKDKEKGKKETAKSSGIPSGRAAARKS